MPKFKQYGDTDKPVKKKVKTVSKKPKKKRGFLEDVKITPEMEKTYRNWMKSKSGKYMLKKRIKR